MDSLLRTTTPIKYPDYEFRDSHSTGFFFRTNHEQYLVTARHCLFQSSRDPEGPFEPEHISIRLRDKSNHGQSRSQRVALYEGGRPRWIEPYHHHVDIAALPLGFSLRDTGNRSFGTVLLDKAYEPHKITSPGLSAIVAGYPILNSPTYEPILRNALISTGLDVDFDDCPYFLIDSNLHKGTSGSPVIVHKEDREYGDSFSVIGVHSGRYDLSVEGGENLNRVWFLKPLRDRLNDIEPGLLEMW